MATSAPKPPRTSAAPRRWADIDQVAEYLGTGSLTVRRRIADGTLRGYRLGSRAIRLDLNEVDAAMRPIPTASTS